jgi:hypothetical protein
LNARSSAKDIVGHSLCRSGLLTVGKRTAKTTPGFLLIAGL